LRSIVGTGPRRLALINNATLATGESGKAHLGTNLIVLKCVEIGDDWVVVEVGVGEPRRVERLQLPREKPQSGDALRVLQ
jgi:hypothetical protein